MERIVRYLLFMLPGFGLGVLAYLFLLWLGKRRLAARGLSSGAFREAAKLLFCVYCGGMAVITLVPEPGWLFFALQGDVNPYFDFSRIGEHISLMPFSQLDSLFNILANIVMFLPFGFFAALLWRGFGWGRAAALSFGITAFIECWQLLLGRYFDIDDIIFNALGVFCGWLLGMAVKRLSPRFAAKLLTAPVTSPD